MDTPSQSPTRSVKVTYSRKQKRKRDLSKDSETRSAKDSDSPSDDEPVKKPASPSKSPSSKKKMSDMRPPDSVVPVASRSLTGSPKRARTEVDASESASLKSQSKKSHARGSSSITSLKIAALQANFTPPSSKKKSASIRGHKSTSSISQQHIAPSESDFDDGASVTDSVASTLRVRRTEAERIEYFKNQPECGSLEANRAKCLRCNKYISLGKQTSYNVRPWEKHRGRCDLKPAVTVEPQTSLEADEEARPERTFAQGKHKTEDERKSILVADPNTEQVKADQVLCRKCQLWIRLRSSTTYDLYNWNKHKKACCTPIPSSKVATAQRKLELVNDSRVKSFDQNHVICGNCDNRIELMNDVDYNLTLWEEHKAGCSEFDSRSNRSDKSGNEAQSAKAPASVGSTSTVVSPERPVSKGVKRPLEDSEIDLPLDDPDARPQNRPRTEAYVTPDKEPPSFLGWFMMPFKSFVRGFTESMNRDASASLS